MNKYFLRALSLFQVVGFIGIVLLFIPFLVGSINYDSVFATGRIDLFFLQSYVVVFVLLILSLFIASSLWKKEMAIVRKRNKFRSDKCIMISKGSDERLDFDFVNSKLFYSGLAGSSSKFKIVIECNDLALIEDWSVVSDRDVYIHGQYSPTKSNLRFLVTARSPGNSFSFKLKSKEQGQDICNKLNDILKS